MTEDRGPSVGGADDHAALLSELDSHDLSTAADVAETADDDAFAFDPGADPDEAFPQSVASGGPTPEGVVDLADVTAEYRGRA